MLFKTKADMTGADDQQGASVGYDFDAVLPMSRLRMSAPVGPGAVVQDEARALRDALQLFPGTTLALLPVTGHRGQPEEAAAFGSGSMATRAAAPAGAAASSSSKDTSKPFNPTV